MKWSPPNDLNSVLKRAALSSYRAIDKERCVVSFPQIVADAVDDLCRDNARFALLWRAVDKADRDGAKADAIDMLELIDVHIEPEDVMEG